MTDIKQFLDSASKAYYAGSPIISDEQFDRLADSVGYSAVGAKQHENKEKHFYQMYSLQKYYEDEGARPLQGIKNLSYTIKLDGAAISLLYIDGQLVRALTRGDGIEGQIITDKLLATKLVPHKIANKSVLQITGEIVAPSAIENSRNYAAGSLNLKDVNEFKTRALSFFAYGVFPSIKTTFDEDMATLKSYGFGVINEDNLDNIFPSDGTVFRVNDNKQFYELGYTAKHPRGAYAKKQRAAHVETVLKDVEWQVGKTGKVTPVAILEPVTIDDKVITRATLNNPGFIRSLNICIGDTVAVALAGMIIPQVLHKVDA